MFSVINNDRFHSVDDHGPCPVFYMLIGSLRLCENEIVCGCEWLGIVESSTVVSATLNNVQFQKHFQMQLCTKSIHTGEHFNSLQFGENLVKKLIKTVCVLAC